jgi:hypothetical protein
MGERMNKIEFLELIKHVPNDATVEALCVNDCQDGRWFKLTEPSLFDSIFYDKDRNTLILGQAR